MLPRFVLGVRYLASFWNWSVSKSKIKPNFEIFTAPLRVKIRGRVSEMPGPGQSSIIVAHCGCIRGFRYVPSF